jgi:SAM-dependent methyltransferase
MKTNRLTTKEDWEAKWDRVRLPAVISSKTKHPVAQEILSVFQKYLPRDRLSAVEVGGASGQFMAYLSKHLDYEANIIDYSAIGCKKTKENFDLLALDVNVYQQDIYDDLSCLPLFDVVYSLGFIEHFRDWHGILRRHVDLLKKDGILILGVPDYRGVGQKVLSRTAPKMLARHNLEAMDIHNWAVLEKTYKLTCLFKGYIGGFQPKNLKRCEDRTPINLTARYFFKWLHYLVNALPYLRKINSPAWSAYLMGVYQAPPSRCVPSRNQLLTA